MRLCSMVLLCSVFPSLALAHTASPYLLPEAFDSKAETVSLQSAITVEKFFVPSRNFKTSYLLTAPNGDTQTIEAAAQLKRFSVAEVATPSEGTYRIRTTQAEGNTSKYALVDGRWLRVRQPRPAMTPPAGDKAADKPAEQRPAAPANQPPRFITEDKLPAGAKTLDVVNTPIAESYISKGKPSAIAAPTGKGFEVKLLSHPNELYAGEALKAQVLFDGKPVPNLEVDVFKGASGYDRNAKREQPHVKTNRNGEIEVKFDQSGIYLITTAYPEAEADNSKPPVTQTYTYGLTLEVAE
jgi:hypothetical protein